VLVILKEGSAHKQHDGRADEYGLAKMALISKSILLIIPTLQKTVTSWSTAS